MTNYYTSFVFLVVFLFSVVLYRVVTHYFSSKGFRNIALLIYNLGMLFMLSGSSVQSQLLFFAGMVSYVAIAVFGAYYLANKKSLHLIYPAFTVFFLVVLLLLKYPYYCFVLSFGAFKPQLGFLAWIGISYMFFRSVDLLAYSSKSGQGLSLMTAANYLLFFPAIVSGPINRFRQFQMETDKPAPPLTLDAVIDLISRYSFGVIKVLFIAPVCYKYSAINPDIQLAVCSFGQFVLSLVCYFFYIYFNFSGYTDCAIASGKFIGFTLPENFNNPLASRNLQNFWERWHISLSQWFRDYIFFNLMYKLKKNKIITNTVFATYVSIFITFFIMGAWHGDTIGWIGYGLVLAFGLVITITYGRLADKYIPNIRVIRENSIYRIFSAAGTIGYVCICLSMTLDFKDLTLMVRGW